MRDLANNSQYHRKEKSGNTVCLPGQTGERPESAGINLHKVGDERALHERNSCSIVRTGFGEGDSSINNFMLAPPGQGQKCFCIAGQKDMFLSISQ